MKPCWALVLTGFVAFAVAGCSESAPQDKPLVPLKPVAVPVPPPRTTEPAPAVSDALPSSGSPESARQSADLEKQYRGATDATARRNVLSLLADLGTTEAVEVIGRLFDSERELSLKVELVQALTVFDGQNDRKLSILATGIQAGQPDEVRMVALESLMNLGDQRGIALLQPLLQDQNPDIRTAARDAMDVLKWEPAMP